MPDCPVGFSYRVAMPRFSGLIRNGASAILLLQVNFCRRPRFTTNNSLS